MPTPIHLLRVPYDSAHHAARMGAGPDALAPVAATALRATGHDVRDETIRLADGFHTEAAAGAALARTIAERVRDTTESGRRPIVLSGNCLSSLGTVSGLQRPGDDLAVIWFDAHGDLETPDTSTSGFVDGMALATLLGRAWRALAGTVPGFRPIDGARVVLVGARDLSDAERALAADAGVTCLPPNASNESFDAALDALVERGARRAYVHVDLDAHDPTALPANGFPVPGGLSPDDVRRAVRAIAERLAIAGAAITAYDPSCDPDRRADDVVQALAPLLAE